MIVIQLFLRRGKQGLFFLYSQTIIYRLCHTFCFFPYSHLCLCAFIVLSLICLLTPSSGVSEAHDPSVLLRPLRGHPSPGLRCNLGIDFLSPCPLINHQGLLRIPKQAAVGGKSQSVSFTWPSTCRIVKKKHTDLNYSKRTIYVLYLYFIWEINLWTLLKGKISRFFFLRIPTDNRLESLYTYTQ